MERLRSLIKEVLTVQPKKKDCNCGCGGCAKKSPVITENRIKKAISKGLTYHVENKIPLHESVYRIGSEKHFALINEARKLWVRELIDVSKDDQAILETHLGNFGLYEGEAVPLDMPMVHEDMGEWPKELTSRYSDEYRFELEKVSPTYQDKPGRAKYRVIDIESGELKATPVFGKLESLMAYADNLIKPQGGTQSSNFGESLEEAEFKGKDVELNKPERGGSKAYYVYVKDGDKVKKVSFGSGGLRAKIKNKEARKRFASRHNCDKKKDRTTAGYWSCNLPRYAEQLGLGSNMSTFW